MSQIPPLPSNIQLPPGINPYLIQQAIAFQQAQRMGWTPGQPLPVKSILLNAIATYQLLLRSSLFIHYYYYFF